MMTFRMLALSGFLLFLTSCDKLELAVEVPSCIEAEIRKIQNEEVRNPAAQVWKWEVDENVYYYISSDCCDQYNYLYDEACNVVCAPDGGFSGNGDGNCSIFSGEIKYTLVWEDVRKSKK